MYLIIDNNVTHCCVQAGNEDAKAILAWLWREGRAVAGGDLLREYSDPQRGNFAFVKLFNTLRDAGRAVIWNDDEVDAKTKALRQAGGLRSDDPHVIALAQVSKARALWSRDRDLRRDFADARLINNPRGKFYLPEGNGTRRAAGLRAITRVCKA